MISVEGLAWTLWRDELKAARKAGSASAESIRNLIEETRTLLTEAGVSKRDIQVVFFEICTAVHWDWRQLTDRTFETLLDFELIEFLSEGMDDFGTHIV
jgi:hypothetical protein